MNTLESQLGDLLAEGKTKQIYDNRSSDGTVLVISTDNITAGDGARHDVIPGKAQVANRTTCNVFRLLGTAGIPTAFICELEESTDRRPLYTYGFLARKCTMLPLEVVVRREAHGSYLKRKGEVKKGHRFPELVVEFFLKTTGRKWKDLDLPCDDPLMRFVAGGVVLLHPSTGVEIIAYIPSDQAFDQDWRIKHLEPMSEIARQTFVLLETAWEHAGAKLVDFKVEFGIDPAGNLLLADVIDADSWRVLGPEGESLSKDAYRAGGTIEETLAIYQRVMQMTEGFSASR